MVNIKVYKFNFKLCIICLVMFFMVALGLVYHTSQAQEEDCINVPIIMYHSVLNGKNGTYIVSTDVFENDMKAVISIVGKYTDDFTKTDETNSIYGHLRWKDIKELMQNGKVEFQNHTYNLHKIENGRKGIMKKKSESLEE